VDTYRVHAESFRGDHLRRIVEEAQGVFDRAIAGRGSAAEDEAAPEPTGVRERGHGQLARAVR
jgi:hypothetical protein